MQLNIRKEYARQYPELMLWEIQVSTRAQAVNPDDLIEMLIDHAVEAPEQSGLTFSVFGVDYLNDPILVVSRPKEPLVIVLTLGEAEGLL